MKVIVSIFLFIAIVIIPIAHIQQKQGKKLKNEAIEEANRDAQYTKYKLTLSEMESLEFFGIKTTPSYSKIKKTEDADYTYVTIESTEYTQKAITVLNFILFDLSSGLDAEARALAEEQGFSFENRITIEWFEEHIPEIIEIRSQCFQLEKSDVESYYPSIMSKSTHTPHQLSYVEMETLYQLFWLTTSSDKASPEQGKILKINMHF